MADSTIGPLRKEFSISTITGIINNCTFPQRCYITLREDESSIVFYEYVFIFLLNNYGYFLYKKGKQKLTFQSEQNSQ